MEDGGVTEKTNEPTPWKEGLLPPGPCSQCSYCDPLGWGEGGVGAVLPDMRKPKSEPRGSAACPGTREPRLGMPPGPVVLGDGWSRSCPSERGVWDLGKVDGKRSNDL